MSNVDNNSTSLMSVHALIIFLIAVISSACSPVSVAINRIFSSFTRKGLKFTTLLSDGSFNLNFGVFNTGSAIIRYFQL